MVRASRSFSYYSRFTIHISLAIYQSPPAPPPPKSPPPPKPPQSLPPPPPQLLSPLLPQPLDDDDELAALAITEPIIQGNAPPPPPKPPPQPPPLLPDPPPRFDQIIRTRTRITAKQQNVLKADCETPRGCFFSTSVTGGAVPPLVRASIVRMYASSVSAMPFA